MIQFTWTLELDHAMIGSFIFHLLWWSSCFCSPQRPSNWHGVSVNQNARQIAACGADTTAEDNPWAAILYLNAKFRCGATILESDLAITAAHCVVGKPTHRLRLYYGRTFQPDSPIRDDGFRRYGGSTKIRAVKNHPNYSPINRFEGNDISLLKLDEEIPEFNDFVRPISVAQTLPKYMRMYENGNTVKLAGFGQVSGPQGSGDKDDYPTQMQLVENRIVPHERCNRGNDTFRFGPPTDGLCTRGKCQRSTETKTFKQICSGDSGSGIVTFFQEDNMHYLIGVASFAVSENNEDCGHSDKPSFSISTQHHRAFIYQEFDANEPDPINCRWRQWTEWTKCSRQCGPGTRSRTRSIKREAQHGGRKCIGNERDEEVCNVKNCVRKDTLPLSLLKFSNLVNTTKPNEGLDRFNINPNKDILEEIFGGEDIEEDIFGGDEEEKWHQLECLDYLSDQGKSCGTRNYETVPFLSHGASSPGEFPWVCLVLNQNNNFIGSCVIIPHDSDNDNKKGTAKVLTAAHKLTKVSETDILKIRVGEYDATGFNPPETNRHLEYRVTTIVFHPEFGPSRLENNIAILHTESNIDLRQNNINTACLPSCRGQFDYKFSNGTGTRCWVAGFGKNEFDGKFQVIQNKVDVPIVDQSNCNNVLKRALNNKRSGSGNRFALSPSEMCAGGEVGKDTCTGDGGSPLVCESETGRWTVVGLTAWGVGCGSDVPGVYVRVSQFTDWISRN